MLKKIKTKKERWLSQVLVYAVLAGCYGFSLISTVGANDDSSWATADLGSFANYQYQEDEFIATIGDKLTDTPDTITLQVKNPEPGESWWEKIQTDNYKTLTLTLLDGEEITNSPTDQPMTKSENIASDLEEQRNSLLNKIGSLVDGNEINGLFKTDDDQLKNIDAIDDVDSEYTIWPDYGVKENLIVKGTNGQATNTFYYQLKLDEGIEYFSTKDSNPFNLPDNTYYFVDQQGNYLAHFLPILVYDSNHNLTSQVELQISPTDNKQILMVKVQVDYAWMIDSARQYPIIIDPTIVHNTNTDFSNGRAINRMNLNDNVLSIAQMPAAKDPSVVGLWHMDEESGSSVVDYSGNNNNGTATGATIVDGKFGKGRQTTNSSDQYIQISDSATLQNVQENNYTLETWFKPNSVPPTSGYNNSYQLIGKNGWGMGLYYFNSQKFSMTHYLTGDVMKQVSSTSTFAPGKYYHIVGSVNRTEGTIQLFVNGNLEGMTTFTPNTVAREYGTVPWRIGIHIPGDSTYRWAADGIFDDTIIYNRALTPEEIKADAQNRPYGIYDSSVLDLGADFSKYDKIYWDEQGVQTGDGETPYSTDGLVAQWNFNETSGTTAYNNAGSCEGVCNATLTNMTTTGQDVAPNSGWTATNKRWGDGGLMFDGSNDFISIGHNSNFNLTNSWTVEAWIKRTGPTTTNSDGSIWKFIVRKGTYNTFGLFYDPTSGKVYSNMYNGSAWKSSTSQSVLDVGQWHHIVGVYESNDSGTLKLFFDGALENTTTGVGTPSTNTDPLSIIGTSNISSVSTYWPAILDSTRIYSRALGGDEILSNYQAGNIEIQTRSGETTNPDDGSWDEWKPSGNGTETTLDNVDNNNEANRDTNTKLLIHGDGDNNSTKIFDNSYNKYPLTTAGDVKTKTDQSKFGGSSMYFDGNGDYLQMAYNSDLDLGTKWTVDFWVYPTSTSTAKFLSTRGSSGDGWEISYWGNFVLEGFGSNSGAGVTTGTYPINNWYHIAVVTNNGASKMYVNGQETFSVTNNFNWGAGSHPLRIGLPVPYNEPVTGYLDEIRISKGVARWTANFTPPTSAYNNDSWITTNNDTVVKNEGTSAMKISQCSAQPDANTVALWHLDETGGTGAYIKDSSGNGNDGTLTGTSVVDGISGKARSFNGTSDYFISNNNLNIYGNAEFTMCAWIKWTGNNWSSNWPSFMGNDSTGITNQGLSFTIKEGRPAIDFFNNRYRSTNALNVKSWYYICGTKTPGVISSTSKIYVNGVLVAGAIEGTDATPNINDAPAILGRLDNTRYFQGLIDEAKFDNIARSAEEISEAYRAGRDHRLTRSFDSTQDLSNKTKLPFYVASDRTGNFLETTIGESAFANNEPDANTVGLWHLEEATGSGAYLKDSSNYNNNGTPTGTTFVDGKTGKGRSFNNAVTHYITVPDSSSLDLTTEGTVSAWVKLNTLRNQHIVNKGSNSYVLYVYSTGKVGFGSHSVDEIQSNSTLAAGVWYHIVGVRSGGYDKLYINGVLDNSASKANFVANTANLYIGDLDSSWYTNAVIDEVRIDNIARTSQEIRQAYEISKRTHSVTIDFAASLDSNNLISNNSDQSFTIDATKKGLSQKGSNLFVGDKVIIRENYDGTEYIAQGLIDSVNITTGAITVSSWDSSSTFPSVGYSANADVFKWQREYWDLTGIMDDQIDAANRITVRLTDGSEGRNIWLDDFKTAGNYLTDPTGSLLNSDPNRYIQYRVISSTTDTNISPTFSSVTVKRPPTIDEDNETILAINEGLNRCELTSDPKIQLKNMESANDPYLVGHWKMNETSGNTVADSSGNGNNGTATGTSIADGVMGKSRNFNGSSDYINIVSSSNLNIQGNLTLAAWIKTNSKPVTDYWDIMGKTNGTSPWQGYEFALNSNGSLSIYTADSSTGSWSDDSGYNLADEKWHLVVANLNNTMMQFYVDGQPKGFFTKNIPASNSTNFTIGRTPYKSGRFFRGNIDEVQIFNRALTSEEIKSLAQKRPYGTYTSKVLDLINSPQLNSLTWSELGVQTGSGETPKDATGLVAQWNFNESSGTTATNNAGSCGSACNGTLTNMTTIGQDAGVNSGWTANNKKWGNGALMFDGSNDYLTLPSVLDATNDITIDYWFNISSGGTVISKFGNGTWNYINRLSTDGSGTFDIMTNSGWQSTVLPAGSFSSGWNNFVFIKSSTNTKIFINGSLKISGQISGTPNTGQPINIGRRSDGYEYINGKLDLIKFYSRALTADEIQSNYQAGNIEFQTRSGATADPNDGSWEEWRPAGSGTETTLVNNENDSSNWSWNPASTYMPKSKSDDSVVRLNGNTSTKLQTGILQSDANTVALWHLDETGGSGAYIKDSSGNNNNGTPTGTSVVDGVSGKARSFNGTLSDYIDLGNKLGVSGASSKITIEAWIYPVTNTDANYIINRDNNYFLMTNSAGKVVFSQTDDGNLYHNVWNSTNTITLNTWNHIVVTYNGGSSAGSGVIYINGIANTTNVAYHGSWTNTGSDCRIGSRAANGSFSGKIDEVRVSNIARTPEEIAEAYRMGHDHRLTRSLASNQDLSNNNKISFNIAADQPGTYLQTTIGESAFTNGESDSNTIGLWHLEEVTGSGAYIKDSSDSGNNGTPTGTALADGKIGKGRSFNGSSNYIDVGTNLNPTNNITIQAWAKLNTAQDGVIVGKRNASTDWAWFLRWNASGTFQCAISQSGNDTTYTSITTTQTYGTGTWKHVACVLDTNNTDMYIYVDGVLQVLNTNTISSIAEKPSINTNIGRFSQSVDYKYFNGIIDEVRIDNIARTPEEIHQAYEVGKRSHNVTFDFAASLDSNNLIIDSDDKSFTIDATTKGLSYKAENLFTGDKIIVRENYDGTEYIAQGTVNGVDSSSGSVTVSGWDSGSTFPSSGFTVKADVFKWQTEYIDISQIANEDKDAINQISLRLTNGSSGRNIWLDDLKAISNYLTDPTGSAIASTSNQYLQYRAILTSNDTLLTPSFNDISLDYSPQQSSTLNSASSSAAYLNNLNKNNFPVTCHGVTASEPDLTITCQGSFDQSNWYNIASSQSPLSNVDIAGNTDVSGWNNFPNSDGEVTIYARVSDGTYNSATSSFTIEKDSVNPTINSITSVNGYTASPYFDNNDDGSTNIIFTSANDTAGCKWDETDLSYSAMSNTCSSPTNCDVNLTGEGSHQVYLQCADIAGNEMSNSQAISYTIDTIAPTTAPTCTPIDSTYFKDNLSVVCTTGTGGDLIKYTSDDSSPTILSDQWFDTNIPTTSNFKFISCDFAGNCLDTYSQYNYYQDNIPPVAPTMNNEPQYTAGLNNTVSSNIVSDDGVGGVQYEFCADTSRSMNINIALNKTATASSYGSQYPSLAVNNNINDFWGSGGYPPAWIRIDLGSEQNFNQLKLLPQGSPTGTVYYHIQGSNDGSNFTTIISNATANTYGPTWSTHNFSMQSYRYVRIYCNNWASSWVGIREIEIYNTSDRPTDSCVSSGWEEIPSATYENLIDNTKYYYFVRSRDSLNNISVWSTSVNSIQDNVPPAITGVNSVAGDSIAPFADKTDDGDTVVNFSGSADIADCFWDISDITYEEMANLCSTTSSCTLDLVGEGIKNVYIRCSDIAGNAMPSSYVVNYAIDTVAPTTAPTCTPENNTYFSNQLAASCTTGFGGTIIRYTNNGNTPSDASTIWEADQTIGATTTFKLISCDDANNCFGEYSTYTYNKDTTPPPTPAMVVEPQLSPGTTNTVTSNTVTDSGVGGVNYQFCFNTSDTTENCSNSDWLTSNSYTFTSLAHEVKYYYFVRSKDALDNMSSWSTSTSSTQDNVPPAILSITDIGGDSTSPYLDSTDDGVTVANFISSADTANCKWATVDVAYDLMIHNCSSTSSCTFNLTGPSTKMIYLRCQDTAGNKMSSSTLMMYDIDIIPTINSITYVEDDSEAPYYDLTDNGDTTIIFGTSNDATACRWDTSDKEYNQMINNCSSTEECTANLTGQGAKTVYLRCIDDQNQSTVNAFEVNYTIDSIAPTAAPTCTPESQIFGDSLMVNCLPGEGGSVIRYSANPNDLVDPTADVWADHALTTTTNLQLISCDEANNCLLEASQYDYTKDSTPPPTPLMVTEPTYTRGTSNTVRSETVTDGGIGGTVEYQFGWNLTGNANSGMTVMSNWTTTPEMIFGYLADNTYYYFVRARDVLGNTSAWSSPTSSIQDNLAATLTAINSVAGDTTPNEWGDNTDDAYTDVLYAADPDVSDCKWSEEDQTYGAMPNTCNSVNRCILNLTGEGEHNVYLRCADKAGNADAVSYDLKYFIDTAPPTTKPTCTATGITNGYFASSVGVTCTPGTGGDEVRYTIDNSTPTWQSTLWSNRSFSQTTTLKAISCDWANNCFDEEEVNTYTQDLVAPALPAMNPEPAYTSGLSNTVSATTVTDVMPGVGLVTYQFRIKYHDGSNWTQSVTAWLEQPEYTFTDLVHNRTYYYSVRARDGLNNLPPDNAWSGEVSSTQDNNYPMVTGVNYVVEDYDLPYVDETDDSNTYIEYTTSDSPTTCRWSDTDESYDDMENTCASTSNCTLTLNTVGDKSVYMRCTDAANNQSPTSYRLDYRVDPDGDGRPPQITAINSVAGDNTSPYFDQTDDGQTVVDYTATTDATTCRWGTIDGVYNDLPNVCTSTSNCNLNLTGNNTKTIYMRCIDGAGNRQRSSRLLAYTIDSLPPTVSLVSVAGDTVAPYYDTSDDNNTVVNISSNDNLAGVQNCRWDESDQSYVTMTHNCESNTQCNFSTYSGESNHTGYIRCVDNIGNAMSSSQTVTFGIDQTEPTINNIVSVAGDTTIPYYDRSNNTDTTIDFNSSDNFSGVADCRWSTYDTSYDNMYSGGEPAYYRNCSGSHCAVGSDYNHNSFWGEGNHTIYLRCRDVAGNRTSTSYPVDLTIDSIPPTVNSIVSIENDLTAPYFDYTDNSQTIIKYTASDNVLGIAGCRWETNNVGYESMGHDCDINNSTCEIDESGQGWHDIFVRCTDLAGNVNSYNTYFYNSQFDETIPIPALQANYYIDTSASNIVIDSVNGQTNSQHYDDNTDDGQTVINFHNVMALDSNTAAEDVAECKWDSENKTYEEMNNVCSSTTSCTSNLTGEGNKTIFIRCKDDQDNISSSKQVDYKIDLTQPQITSLTSVAGDTSVPYYDTNSHDYYAQGSWQNLSTASFVSTDNLSGVQTCRWNTSDTNYETMSNECNSVSNCPVNIADQGVHDIYIRCRDWAGNSMDSSLSYEYTYDIDGPTISINAVENDMTAPYFDYTDNGNTAVDFEVNDNVLGVASCKWDHNTSNYNLMTNTCDNLGLCIFNTMGEEAQTNYIACSDQGGNTTSQTINYWIDTRPPIITSITSVAGDTTANDYNDNTDNADTLVIFKTLAEDTAECKWSQNNLAYDSMSNVCEGTDRCRLNLTGDGQKKVYLRCKDQQNKKAITPYVVNYNIDTTPPNISSITQVANDYIAPYFDPNVDFVTPIGFVSVDNVSGVESCQYHLGNPYYKYSCDNTGLCTVREFTGITNRYGSHTAYIKCKDYAQNEMADYYPVNYTTDYRGPDISLISVAEDTTAPYYDTSDDGNTVVTIDTSDLAGAAACRWGINPDPEHLPDYRPNYNQLDNICESTEQCTLYLMGQGTKTIYMRCLDNLGNQTGSDDSENRPFIFSYTIDSSSDGTPPRISKINSVAGDTAAVYYDNSDDQNTVVSYQVDADTNTCKWDVANLSYDNLGNTCESTNTCNFNLAGEGAKKVYFKCIDNAGNKAITPYILRYTIDNTPPTVLDVVTIAGDPNTPYFDNTDDGQTIMLYHASSDTAACKWSSIDQSYATMPNTCTSTEQCNFNLSGWGEKNVYMRCLDNAGNVGLSSYAISYTLDAVADGTPPVIQTITSVAGDETPTYYDSSDDSNTEVFFTASPDATECKWNTLDVSYEQMQNFCESTSQCTLNVSGRGAKTVYMKCMDNAGNMAVNSYALDYIIETMTPRIQAVTAVAGDNNYVYVDQTDDGQTLVEYETTEGTTECKWDTLDTNYDNMNNTCQNTERCLLDLTGAGSHKVYMRCKNAANMKSDVSFKLNYEIGQPITEEKTSSITAQVRDSIPHHPNTVTVYYNPALDETVNNGSIKLILSDEFDLSGLTKDDVMAVGGGVEWTNNEIITVAGEQIAYRETIWDKLAKAIGQPQRVQADGENSIIFPYVGDLSGDNSDLQFIIGNANEILNPLTAGTYNVTVEVRNQDGETIDTLEAMIAISEEINVTAAVPSSLTFTINPVASGEMINNNTTNQATLSAESVDFGIFRAAEDHIAAHDLVVSTNASGGYAVTVQYSGQMTGNTGTMTDFIGTNSDPQEWSYPSGPGVESYFGYTTNDFSLSQSIVDRFAENKWAAFTNTPMEVAADNQSVDGQITRIGYRLQITDKQPAGVYNTSIMYVCTSTY